MAWFACNGGRTPFQPCNIGENCALLGVATALSVSFGRKKAPEEPGGAEEKAEDEKGVAAKI